MRNRVLYGLLIFMILMSGNKIYAEEFSDVPYGFWAYKEISSSSDNHYMSAYPDGKFLPDKFVTRAEYATMIVKAIGQENIEVDKTYSFDDINASHWAWDYVIRALNLDILLPVDEYHFYPDDFITKADVITFLVNILKSEEITKKEALHALQNAYDDFDDIPDWFKITAGKAEVLNIIPKEPPNERILDCNKNVTRAEMAVFLYNLKEKIDAYKVLEEQENIEKNSPQIAESGIVIENTLQTGDISVIPAGTSLPIVISGNISSKTSSTGDMFNAKFPDNILDDKNQLLLSKNIILTGKILEAKKGKPILKNGELFVEISGANNKNLSIRIMGFAQFDIHNINTGKFRAKVYKGKNFEAKDGQIVYFKLYAPLKVNLVTGEILN